MKGGQTKILTKIYLCVCVCVCGVCVVRVCAPSTCS